MFLGRLAGDWRRMKLRGSEVIAISTCEISKLQIEVKRNRERDLVKKHNPADGARKSWMAHSRFTADSVRRAEETSAAGAGTARLARADAGATRAWALIAPANSDVRVNGPRGARRAVRAGRSR